MNASPHTIRSLVALIGAGLCLALGSIVGAGGPATAQAADDMSVFWAGCQGPDPDGAAGTCGYETNNAQSKRLPGLAVDPQSGDIYVSDLTNRRITQLTSWGQFVRAFGWDVAPEGAPGDTPQDELETCTTECQRGEAGDGAGQLDDPMGLAVDSQGGLFVWDHGNTRLQKFDTSGEEVAFEWMVGAGVEKGPLNPGDICTADDLAAGDSCGAGASGTGPRQFSGAPLSGGHFGVQAWPFVAVDPNGPVYVGDENRIQRLDTEGTYQGEFELPEPGRVGALAVDPVSDDVYFAYASVASPGSHPSRFGSAWAALQPDVYRLDEATGAVLDVLPVQLPRAISVSDAGEVFVYDEESGLTGGSPPFHHEGRILVFGSGGGGPDVYLDSAFRASFPSGGSTQWEIASLAVSNACGVTGSTIYVAGGWERLLSGNVTQYHTSVRAFGSPPDPALCPPPERAPTIEDSFAAEVGVDSAEIRAQINPRFWPDATYRIEYGTQGPCSENDCASTPEESVTEQVVDRGVVAATELSNLEEGTEYHYRVVAKSTGGGPVFGPDKTFTTFIPPDPLHTDCENQSRRPGPSERLPDCRAFERVSPADKNSVDVRVLEKPLYQAALDGNGFGFTAHGAFADPESGPVTSAYLAQRDPEEGWSTRALSPPRSGPSYLTGGSAGQQAFSEDLCSFFVLNEADTDAIPGDQPGYPDLYRRENCGEPNAFEVLTIAAPMNRPPGLIANDPYLVKVQGFSADGNRAFFRANVKLTNNAANNREPQLYVKDGSTLRLVSVLPSLGGTTPGGPWSGYTSYGTAYILSFWDELTNGDLNIGNDITSGAISRDGSKAYWTATALNIADPARRGIHAGRIYLRLNPHRPQSPVSGGECTDATLACTIRVSETVSNDPAAFLGAIDDGSEALFLFTGGDREGELYRFRLESHTSSLIAEGVKGILGASADLDVVYVVSTEELAAGAEEGKLNIFRAERGGDTNFVATLPNRDVAGGSLGGNVDSPLHMAPRKHTARVTPDGNRVVFTSSGALTGADNRDVESGEPVDQVFLFDAGANGGEGELRCISCNRTGARPVGRRLPDWGGGGIAGTERPVSSRVPGWASSLHPSRAISVDGERVFFESFDRLSLLDRDDKMDVYQWEKAGAGTCDEQDSTFNPEAGGCVELITGGESDDDAAFLGASSDGSSLFVRSRDALVPWDHDGLIDIYDARIGGGFVGPAEPTQPCEGDKCQAPATAPPVLPNIGSVSVGGDGNVPLVPGRVRASVGVSKLRAVSGSAARLRVRVPGAGRILLAGSQVRPIGVSASKAGTYSVKIRLRPRARKLLRKRKRLRVSARVSFRARGGQSASRTVKVTFKQPKSKRAKAEKGGR